MKKYFAFVILLALALMPLSAEAKTSNEWIKLLEPRTCTVVVEGADLGGIIVGGRGKVSFTWLDRGLRDRLRRDSIADEWISTGLGYYNSSNSDVVKKVKKRDVFYLAYNAMKPWDFKIEEITIGGYTLTKDDILTPEYVRHLGLLASDKTRDRMADEDEDLGYFELHVVVPSIKKGQTIKISYAGDSVEWTAPKK